MTTGTPLSKSSAPTFSSLFGDFLIEKAANDDKIVAITAAMCEGTGLEQFAKTYPKRCFDVGIAEEHAVSFAAGLAKGGMKPVVCIYSSFLQRAYDQILEDVCIQNLPVVFAIDRAGCVGADGETHHGMFDLSYLSSIPNMTVLTPKDANQLNAMLDFALNYNGPIAIRYPRGSAEYDKNIMSTYELKNIRIASGTTVDIWACGKMFKCGEEVCKILRSRGIDAGLVDVTTVKPLDLSPMNELKELPKLIVTIEDNTCEGGLGSRMASAFSGTESEVLKCAWPDEFIPQGTVEQLAERYGLTAKNISERICDYLERKA
jgi:1-deoxy-D-xylulose-5-phosphate synthase